MANKIIHNVIVVVGIFVAGFVMGRLHGTVSRQILQDQVDYQYKATTVFHKYLHICEDSLHAGL